MNYIDRLNSFNLWLESNALEPVPQLLYFKLLNVFNRAGWPETVQVDNQRIMSMICSTSEKSARAARDRLIATGLISYQRGKKGIPGRYALIPIPCPKYGADSGPDYVPDNGQNLPGIFYPVNFTGNQGTNQGSNQGSNRDAITPPYKDKEKDKDKDKRDNNTPLPPFAETPRLQEAVTAWLTYKQERRQKYTPTGLSRLYGQIRKYADQYGADAVANLIDECMAANWQGIIFEKLQKGGGQNGHSGNDGRTQDARAREEAVSRWHLERVPID